MKELTIEITPYCLLNCVHCSHDKEKEADIDHPHFEYGEVREFMDRYPQFEAIRFSGGEPFRDSRLIAYAREAKERGKRVSIVTSGVYDSQLGSKGVELIDIPQEIIDGLLGYVDQISFSIYGGENIHDSITRTVGSFRCLDRSVDKIRNAKIPFSFVSVALKNSARGIEDAVKYVALKKRLSGTNPLLTYLRFIKQGSGGRKPTQALDRGQLNMFMERAVAFGRRYDVSVNFGCSLLEQGCRQGTEKAAISSSGEYFNCSALKHNGKQVPFGCRDRW